MLILKISNKFYWFIKKKIVGFPVGKFPKHTTLNNVIILQLILAKLSFFLPNSVLHVYTLYFFKFSGLPNSISFSFPIIKQMILPQSIIFPQLRKKHNKKSLPQGLCILCLHYYLQFAERLIHSKVHFLNVKARKLL